MAEIHKSIEVDAPVERVYGYWSNLENLPEILDHVENVQMRGTGSSHWTVSIGGKTLEWDATHTAETNRELSWTAVGDVVNSGNVRFTPLGTGKTRVEVTIRHEPTSAVEKAGERMGLDERAVQDDLEKFKRNVETGKV